MLGLAEVLAQAYTLGGPTLLNFLLVQTSSYS